MRLSIKFSLRIRQCARTRHAHLDIIGPYCSLLYSLSSHLSALRHTACPAWSCPPTLTLPEAMAKVRAVSTTRILG